MKKQQRSLQRQTAIRTAEKVKDIDERKQKLYVQFITCDTFTKFTVSYPKEATVALSNSYYAESKNGREVPRALPAFPNFIENIYVARKQCTVL